MSELLKSFIAGWIGGVGNLIVGHPFDTVKTLMQNSKPGEFKSSLDCMQQLMRKEGAFAVYKGVQAPMAGVGGVFALYFLAYDTTERALRSMKGITPEKNISLFDCLICGGATGLFGSLILGPAELIKIQQQTATSQGLDGSFAAVNKHIRANFGMAGYYRGFMATILRDVPGSMAWFGAYEMVKQTLCEDPKKPSVAQALIAGGCGGLAMWSFAIPLDTIKTRVQASRGGRMSIASACSSIMREQGTRGFYKGIGPALLRAFPANAATFACKEFAQSNLDRLF